ncbi:MAG TPA: hypothetical protein VJG32_04695 [Anaerolineae bacterium]|nr:hypothetical protein [Anaerolineae bacterium]
MPARRILVEVKVDRDLPPETALAQAREWTRLGFEVDPTYRAVPMSRSGDAAYTTAIIRGTLQAGARLDDLRMQPAVVDVWEDAPIGPVGN